MDDSADSARLLFGYVTECDVLLDGAMFCHVFNSAITSDDSAAESPTPQRSRVNTASYFLQAF